MMEAKPSDQRSSGSIKLLIDRFREAPPTSRDERQKLKTSEVGTDLWWRKVVVDDIPGGKVDAVSFDIPDMGMKRDASTEVAAPPSQENSLLDASIPSTRPSKRWDVVPPVSPLTRTTADNATTRTSVAPEATIDAIFSSVASLSAPPRPPTLANVQYFTSPVASQSAITPWTAPVPHKQHKEITAKSVADDLDLALLTFRRMYGVNDRASFTGSNDNTWDRYKSAPTNTPATRNTDKSSVQDNADERNGNAEVAAHEPSHPAQSTQQSLTNELQHSNTASTTENASDKSENATGTENASVVGDAQMAPAPSDEPSSTNAAASDKNTDNNDNNTATVTQQPSAHTSATKSDNSPDVAKDGQQAAAADSSTVAPSTFDKDGTDSTPNATSASVSSTVFSTEHVGVPPAEKSGASIPVETGDSAKESASEVTSSATDTATTAVLTNTLAPEHRIPLSLQDVTFETAVKFVANDLDSCMQYFARNISGAISDPGVRELIDAIYAASKPPVPQRPTSSSAQPLSEEPAAPAPPLQESLAAPAEGEMELQTVLEDLRVLSSLSATLGAPSEVPLLGNHEVRNIVGALSNSDAPIRSSAPALLGDLRRIRDMRKSWTLAVLQQQLRRNALNAPAADIPGTELVTQPHTQPDFSNSGTRAQRLELTMLDEFKPVALADYLGRAISRSAPHTVPVTSPAALPSSERTEATLSQDVPGIGVQSGVDEGKAAPDAASAHSGFSADSLQLVNPKAPALVENAENRELEVPARAETSFIPLNAILPARSMPVSYHADQSVAWSTAGAPFNSTHSFPTSSPLPPPFSAHAPAMMPPLPQLPPFAAFHVFPRETLATAPHYPPPTYAAMGQTFTPMVPAAGPYPVTIPVYHGAGDMAATVDLSGGRAVQPFGARGRNVNFAEALHAHESIMKALPKEMQPAKPRQQLAGSVVEAAASARNRAREILRKASVILANQEKEDTRSSPGGDSDDESQDYVDLSSGRALQT